MEDLRRYIEEIVEPTVKDFAEHPASVRQAFLACVVTYHAVDYMAHLRRKPRMLAQIWGSQSEAFRRVDEVAHAFKHVISTRRRPNLNAGAGFIVGYRVSEHSSAVAPLTEQSGASGWIEAFLILIAILAWGHVKLDGSHQPIQSTNHATLAR